MRKYQKVYSGWTTKSLYKNRKFAKSLGVLAPKKLHVSPTKLVTNDEVFVVKHAGKIAKYLFLGAKTPRILGAKTPNKGPDL